MYYVYVLQSDTTGHLYVGQTKDLSNRVSAHNDGLARYTRSRGPWTLVHSEEYETRGEAMVRERQLKGGQGREWLKTKIRGSD